jgi:hypothetical protein
VSVALIELGAVFANLGLLAVLVGAKLLGA